MEKIIPWIALLLLGAVVYLWMSARGRQKKHNARVRELESQLTNLKNRRQTANGGLSRGDKLKVLDLIAKADAIEDDNQLVQLRVADLKRSLIEFLKKESK